MTISNGRSLDAIADDIHGLERKSIFAIGDLLLEAKSQCEHGDWLSWLSAEFAWSTSTAENYMAVARLRAKFPTVGNLKVTARTLYDLAGRNDDDLATIVAELAKHATQRRLSVDEAERVIWIGAARHQYGDHPDATLVRLGDGFHISEKAIAALLERNPETEEEAAAIIDEAEAAEDEAEDEDDLSDETKSEEELEADRILDGPPPELPPPTPAPEPPEPQGESTPWAGGMELAIAFDKIFRLSTQSATRFTGRVRPSRVPQVCDFLMAIRAADNAKCADKSATAMILGTVKRFAEFAAECDQELVTAEMQSGEIESMYAYLRLIRAWTDARAQCLPGEDGSPSIDEKAKRAAENTKAPLDEPTPSSASTQIVPEAADVDPAATPPTVPDETPTATAVLVWTVTPSTLFAGHSKHTCSAAGFEFSITPAGMGDGFRHYTLMVRSYADGQSAPSVLGRFQSLAAAKEAAAQHAAEAASSASA
jgi:hypothetical protein